MNASQSPRALLVAAVCSGALALAGGRAAPRIKVDRFTSSHAATYSQATDAIPASEMAEIVSNQRAGTPTELAASAQMLTAAPCSSGGGNGAMAALEAEVARLQAYMQNCQNLVSQCAACGGSCGACSQVSADCNPADIQAAGNRILALLPQVQASASGGSCPAGAYTGIPPGITMDSLAKRFKLDLGQNPKRGGRYTDALKSIAEAGTAADAFDGTARSFDRDLLRGEALQDRMDDVAVRLDDARSRGAKDEEFHYEVLYGELGDKYAHLAKQRRTEALDATALAFGLDKPVDLLAMKGGSGSGWEAPGHPLLPYPMDSASIAELTNSRQLYEYLKQRSPEEVAAIKAQLAADLKRLDANLERNEKQRFDALIGSQVGQGPSNKDALVNTFMEVTDGKTAAEMGKSAALDGSLKTKDALKKAGAEAVNAGAEVAWGELKEKIQKGAQKEYGDGADDVAGALLDGYEAHGKGGDLEAVGTALVKSAGGALANKKYGDGADGLVGAAVGAYEGREKGAEAVGTALVKSAGEALAKKKYGEDGKELVGAVVGAYEDREKGAEVVGTGLVNFAAGKLLSPDTLKASGKVLGKVAEEAGEQSAAVITKLVEVVIVGSVELKKASMERADLAGEKARNLELKAQFDERVMHTKAEKERLESVLNAVNQMTRQRGPR